MRITPLFFLAALLLTACGGAAGATTSAPRIVLEATTLELGEVPNGVIAEREVRVRNDGDSPLIVESVVTTCGCTTAVLDPTTVAPGGAAALRIAFDSGAHGPDLRGPIMRRVILTSNDPVQPEAILELRADIVDPAAP